MKVVCQLWVFDWQQRWPCSSSSISLITTQYWVADLKNWNIKWPKNRKTCLYLVFLHMALAFLLLQTGFTKGSEDCRLNHRWKIMRMSMTTLQRYIYDQRLPHGSGQKAVTDSKKKKKEARKPSRNTAVQHQTRDKPDGLSRLKCSSRR